MTAAAAGLLELGITPREAMFLEYIGGFAECFASMTHLAKKIGVSQRHGFRLQASLREKGLVGSRQARDRNATPTAAKKPAQLRHNGWAVREVSGVAALWFAQRRAKFEQWRQARDEKRENHRQEMRRRREAQANRGVTENPPPSPPHNRPFPAEPAHTGPVQVPPAAVWSALGRKPPPG